MYGRDNDATHFIKVNGNKVTYTQGHDPDFNKQSSATSIVLHLEDGQEVGIDPVFTGTIDGFPDFMKTSFGATLLYAYNATNWL